LVVDFHIWTCYYEVARNTLIGFVKKDVGAGKFLRREIVR
jgi:hypothetical protein